MCALYQSRFRIESTRLRTHDYSGDGMYFVTICTRNKIPYFGEIISGEMVISSIGQIAVNFWNEIPLHFPAITLDEYVIMPDHIHGIIINQISVETPNLGVSTINCNKCYNLISKSSASFSTLNFFLKSTRS